MIINIIIIIHTQGTKVHTFIFDKDGGFSQIDVNDIETKFIGIPDNIDAAYQYDNNSIYIYKGSIA